MERNKTWRKVVLPPDFAGNILSTKWILTKKYDQATGKIERYKARLVCKGHGQTEGVEYDIVYAPVVNVSVLRVFLCFTASRKWVLKKIDVRNAYLHASVEETLYIWEPDGFQTPQPTDGSIQVLKLDKAVWFTPSRQNVEYIVEQNLA